jgi:hypothetical protein
MLPIPDQDAQSMVIRCDNFVSLCLSMEEIGFDISDEENNESRIAVVTYIHERLVIALLNEKEEPVRLDTFPCEVTREKIQEWRKHDARQAQSH